MGSMLDDEYYRPSRNALSNSTAEKRRWEFMYLWL